MPNFDPAQKNWTEMAPLVQGNSTILADFLT